MHHSYLDKYARGDSFLHRLDPRTKTVLVFATVLLIALLRQPGALFLISGVALILTLAGFARLPLRYLLIRSAVVIPFAGFAIFSYVLTLSGGDVYFRWGPLALTSVGLSAGVRLFVRAWLSVSLMILLINTTPFDRLLASLRFFRIPSLLVMLLAFLYRYLYLLWDEAERLERARNVRYFGGHLRQQPAVLGNLVAALFLRSYDRSENIRMAMEARGWNGEPKSSPHDAFSLRDKLILIMGLFFLVLLWLIRNI